MCVYKKKKVYFDWCNYDCFHLCTDNTLVNININLSSQRFYLIPQNKLFKNTKILLKKQEMGICVI